MTPSGTFERVKNYCNNWQFAAVSGAAVATLLVATVAARYFSFSPSAFVNNLFSRNVVVVPKNDEKTPPEVKKSPLDKSNAPASVDPVKDYVPASNYQPDGRITDSLLFRLALAESMLENRASSPQLLIPKDETLKDIAFGTINQFQAKGDRACTFCASIFLSRILDPQNKQNVISTKWIDEIIQDGTTLFKLSGVKENTDLVEVQQICDRLRVGRLPLSDVPENLNYIDTMAEIGLENPQLDYENVLENHLPKHGYGLIISIHGYTISIARLEDAFYLFDSHGAQHVTEESPAAFVGKFVDISTLADFLAKLYPPHDIEEVTSLNELAEQISQMKSKNLETILGIVIANYPDKEEFIKASLPSTYRYYEEEGLLNHPNNIKLLIASSIQFSTNAAMLTPVFYESDQ
ncbi:MAG: hypothetical protein ChlgKO_09260 [Chlamydiales bacterium]